MTTCEHCQGKGWFDAFVQRWGVCNLESIECQRCMGSGQVTEEQAAQLVEGRRRRDDRIARGLNIREEAKRLGITAVELGRIERGIHPRAGGEGAS